MSDNWSWCYSWFCILNVVLLQGAKEYPYPIAGGWAPQSWWEQHRTPDPTHQLGWEVRMMTWSASSVLSDFSGSGRHLPGCWRNPVPWGFTNSAHRFHPCLSYSSKSKSCICGLLGWELRKISLLLLNVISLVGNTDTALCNKWRRMVCEAWKKNMREQPRTLRKCLWKSVTE